MITPHVLVSLISCENVWYVIGESQVMKNKFGASLQGRPDLFLPFAQVKIQQAAMELELMPFNVLLRTTLDLLQEKDPAHIFAEPVNLSEASSLTTS